MGVEPTIFTLQKWCIANYATTPFKNLTPIYSISQTKNLPYPIWIRFVRVRHTGVYRVPHAVGRFHPTRTSLQIGWGWKNRISTC